MYWLYTYVTSLNKSYHLCNYKLWWFNKKETSLVLESHPLFQSIKISVFKTSVNLKHPLQITWKHVAWIYSLTRFAMRVCLLMKCLEVSTKIPLCLKRGKSVIIVLFTTYYNTNSSTVKQVFKLFYYIFFYLYNWTL